MTSLGADISHYQGEPNWPGLAQAIGFIVLKATEGTTYIDPVWVSRRAAAHKVGLVVGSYHFARLGDVHAEVAAYLAALGGALPPTEFAALDLEVTAGGVDLVAWAAAWLDAMHAATGRWPLLYLNQALLGSHDWTPIASRGVHLWLARYDNSQAAVPTGVLPLQIKQFSDVATVPGLPGQVDEDVLYGPLTDLTGGDAMPTAQEIADAIWNYPINGVRARDRLEGMDSIQLPALAKALAEVHSKTVGEIYDLTGRPADRPDDLLGHVLSADARARDTELKLDSLAAAVTALAAAVGKSAAPVVDVAALLKAAGAKLSAP